MGSDQDENRRYEAIDALRAIAVMLVLIFHYTSRFPADYIGFDHQMTLPWQGIVGVFLFFIISGYCIAMTAERSETVWVFWLQRFTRLEPALIACIAITLIVVAALGLPGREVSALDGLKNASWVTLFVQTPLVDGAYWSLLAEAKFTSCSASSSTSGQIAFSSFSPALPFWAQLHIFPGCGETIRL